MVGFVLIDTLVERHECTQEETPMRERFECTAGEREDGLRVQDEPQNAARGKVSRERLKRWDA